MSVFKKPKDDSQAEAPQIEETQAEAQPHAGQAQNGMPDPLDKLGMIRDIIFGQNMEEYNRQFDELKKMVDEKKAELDHYIKDVKGDLQEKIQELDRLMKDQVHNLEDSFAAKAKRLEEDKMNRATLGELLIDIGNKIKA